MTLGSHGYVLANQRLSASEEGLCFKELVGTENGDEVVVVYFKVGLMSFGKWTQDVLNRTTFKLRSLRWVQT